MNRTCVLPFLTLWLLSACADETHDLTKGSGETGGAAGSSGEASSVAGQDESGGAEAEGGASGTVDPGSGGITSVGGTGSGGRAVGGATTGGTGSGGRATGGTNPGVGGTQQTGGSGTPIGGDHPGVGGVIEAGNGPGGADPGVGGVIEAGNGPGGADPGLGGSPQAGQGSGVGGQVPEAGAPGSGGQAGCAAYDEQQCPDVNGCMSIVSVDGLFWECQTLTGCSEAEVCARTSAGSLPHRFPTGCIPGGWEEVDFALCDTAPDCTELSQQSCTSELGCMPLVSLDGTFWGCEAQAACTEEAVCAISYNPSAHPLPFPNGCIPNGWGVVDVAECDPGSCVTLDETDCRTVNGCSVLEDVNGIYRGCQAMTTCTTGEICATNWGITVAFPSDCLPMGFETVNSSECDNVVCEDLYENECAGRLDICAPILSTDGVYRGCVGIDVACKDDVSCAAGPDGTVAEFAHCVPEGWVDILTTDCARESFCSSRNTLEKCVLTENCMPINGQNLGFLSCTTSRGCDGALTCGESPQGVVDLFSDSCLPLLWTAVQSSACQ